MIWQQICWQRTKSGWTKVNTDGARQLKRGYEAAEGSIRDENDVRKSSFARYVVLLKLNYRITLTTSRLSDWMIT
ncbi:hypothetical protein PVK06_029084 [Gossypium arboreum]|uniref:Uncharacterized protein n=1 Tax=Gossypium arboreum TaxID=29729 RepID=A0ABR0P5P3_GOSAR|nr:hypothetical protein PVK06_029084 [Gossypium arboreum]